MFKYARKNINKWLNNSIKLHFIMKHSNMTQWRVLCGHNHLLKLQLLPATSASCPVRDLSSPRVGVSASCPVTVATLFPTACYGGHDL